MNICFRPRELCNNGNSKSIYNLTQIPKELLKMLQLLTISTIFESSGVQLRAHEDKTARNINEGCLFMIINFRKNYRYKNKFKKSGQSYTFKNIRDM